jgi:hypothetical protein
MKPPQLCSIQWPCIRLPTPLWAILLSVGMATTVHAQAADERPNLDLPDCDIFLFDFSERNGNVTISKGVNITQRPGYDNQPFFKPNSESLVFSSSVAPDRTDIYEFVIESGETKQLTDSPEQQEYSPQISPDQKTLSFVTDGEHSNQSIWKTQIGSGHEEWLLASPGEREPVGYYSWRHRLGYILFWSRYGHSLRLVHEQEKTSHYITGDAPPSTPHLIPGSNKFSFLHRQGNGETWVKELDPITRAVRPLTKITGNNNNYGWTPERRILMIDGTKLHACFPEGKKEWAVVADLGEHGLKSATRLAVSHDGKKIAIVGLE